MVPFLESAGHTVYAVTLSGLEPDGEPMITASANLDTHADDVIHLLDRARITDATLVGHSYAGMVITAAADRAGGRVTRVVHLDAYVPHDGDSCWSLTTDGYRQKFVDGATSTGFSVVPPAGGDPRRHAHPFASLVQSIRLTGAFERVPRHDFVYCSGWDGTPFAEQRARLAADPNWNVYELPTAHNAMREAPDAVAALLLDTDVQHLRLPA